MENQDFSIAIQSISEDASQQWTRIPSYAVEVANANIASNDFHRHTVALASFDFTGHVKVKVTYGPLPVNSAVIRPLSLNIETELENNQITFTLDKARDIMLELNGDKWKALHLLTNNIDDNTPTNDTDDTWYFGPGINQGSAYAKVTDGVNLVVPSGKTIYLAGGAFITCRLNFVNVSNSAVRGHGFILGPKGGFTHRELGGAIHMSRATNIRVEGVTSLGANGFSLSAGECHNVVIDRYRSFSSAGNGDGIDIFCSTRITIQNCFLRNSDDTIALYSHRWDWYGDSKDILIQNCVLLPDIAHAINMGTHGNPAKPETTSNVTIRNIDILDHEENQMWYQGCIAINAADMNLFEDIHIDNIRVERITRGQLFNVRVMQNGMWTTAPGRAIRNVTFKDVALNMRDSKVVNPSMILGYGQDQQVENITFENLNIGNKVIHEGMDKPKWYMVSDSVPLFVNEHVNGVRFIKTT
ncbi:Polygalacturonase [Penicillium pulvis]|uniref:Polygalacturonase n=1 Tax=Penicillium pulvis TaxID=1562058 RepID=UPI002548B763|nr:Polygalacturonase [Penicillium pulvis]KAJ5802533.1 Polygalacturonase [Penicillium pulvis]